MQNLLKALVLHVSFTAHGFQYSWTHSDLSYTYLMAIYKKMPTNSNSTITLLLLLVLSRETCCISEERHKSFVSNQA